ncbi:MAG: hypothetical protein DDT27_01378 [Dehalococcoidia bacterium]|nr:hypothetical protein [Chloroflexota bacterium]
MIILYAMDTEPQVNLTLSLLILCPQDSKCHCLFAITPINAARPVKFFRGFSSLEMKLQLPIT